MDVLKEKKKTTKYLPIALLLTLIGLIVALRILGAVNTPDLLITAGLIFALFATTLVLKRFNLDRYIFIPVILLVAIGTYASSTLLSLGSFTWSSNANAMLQIFGLLWILSILLFLYALTGRLSPTIITTGVILIVFGVANYAMMQFRGRMFLIGDIAALGTAMNVADNYTLQVSPVFILAILVNLVCCIFGIYLARNTLFTPARRWKLISRVSALVPALAYVLAVCCGGIIEASGIRLTWNENDYAESPVLNFIESVGQLNTKEPDGYSAEALGQITGSVQNTSLQNGSVEKNTTPHIIAIMDESFTNHHMIGDFETSEPLTPFIDSLSKNTIRGYLYSSSGCGGGTANSEFEFLTGCSLAFVPDGTVPYQKCINYEKDSLVSVLEAQGYTSTAMHPYYASGWNREVVYDCFGFDNVLFIDDFMNKEYMRSYVSDESDFQNLIRLYEARDPGERMFIFNITMQNHGSYKNEYFKPTVSIVGHEGEFPEAEQYLSLLKASDTAVQQLITYFSAQDEPVIILFFGDHQPRLEDAFYNMLYGKTYDQLTFEEEQRKYLTPFFIWANYDIQEADVGKTTINYLSSMLLQTAGLESSDFEAFLLELQKQYPIVNGNGYQQAGGEYVSAETSDAESNELIQDYRMLQYNYLFDTDKYIKDFFGLNHIQ